MWGIEEKAGRVCGRTVLAEVSVCLHHITWQRIGSCDVTAHLAAYHNQGAQLIRPQREKLRGGEIRKEDILKV